MPKVSVIVPSFNLGKYLPETLSSVVAQTYEGWECIIVDNGSSDDSLAVSEAFAARDARFRVLAFQENQGVAAARNKGLAEAEGEYILFLDADDLITPGYMAAAVEALEKDPSLTVVYGKAERFGAQTRWDLPAFSMDTMLASNCLYISCFFRKSEAVPFDPSFKTGYEDWDFWLGLLEGVQAPRVLCLPELCFRYRTRRNSRNTGVTDEALREIRFKLWEKHKALYARYFCNPLETVEYRRLERAYKKAARMPLWQLRTALKKLLGR